MHKIIIGFIALYPSVALAHAGAHASEFAQGALIGSTITLIVLGVRAATNRKGD